MVNNSWRFAIVVTLLVVSPFFLITTAEDTMDSILGGDPSTDNSTETESSTIGSEGTTTAGQVESTTMEESTTTEASSTTEMTTTQTAVTTETAFESSSTLSSSDATSSTTSITTEQPSTTATCSPTSSTTTSMASEESTSPSSAGSEETTTIPIETTTPATLSSTTRVPPKILVEVSEAELQTNQILLNGEMYKWNAEMGNLGTELCKNTTLTFEKGLAMIYEAGNLTIGEIIVIKLRPESSKPSSFWYSNSEEVGIVAVYKATIADFGGRLELDITPDLTKGISEILENATKALQDGKGLDQFFGGDAILTHSVKEAKRVDIIPGPTGLADWEIALIVIFTLLGVAILALVTVLLCRKSKKRPAYQNHGFTVICCDWRKCWRSCCYPVGRNDDRIEFHQF